MVASLSHRCARPYSAVAQPADFTRSPQRA
jgi:hypothetical protein